MNFIQTMKLHIYIICYMHIYTYSIGQSKPLQRKSCYIVTFLKNLYWETPVKGKDVNGGLIEVYKREEKFGTLSFFLRKSTLLDTVHRYAHTSIICKYVQFYFTESLVSSITTSKQIILCRAVSRICWARGKVNIIANR